MLKIQVSEFTVYVKERNTTHFSMIQFCNLDFVSSASPQKKIFVSLEFKEEI